MSAAAGKNFKEVASAFRFIHSLQKEKVKIAAPATRAEKLSRYTNFTLTEQFSKFDRLQTLLLQREFLLPTYGANPALANGTWRREVIKTRQ